MKSLKSYLAEEKNLHMEHLEDLVLNGGVEGARAGINYLRGQGLRGAGSEEGMPGDPSYGRLPVQRLLQEQD